VFADRSEAGRRLARELDHLAIEDPVVVGLPRGGVPVAAEVAVALAAPLDVILVRKVGVPFQPELAMGAIGEDGVTVVNSEVVDLAGITTSQFDQVAHRERTELDRRSRLFRQDRTPIGLVGRTVIIVDDGIATGSTARAACQVARAHRAARVVLAVPVAPSDWVARFGDVADEYVAVETPENFGAVGAFYQDFRQVSDDDVVRLLISSAARTNDDPHVDPLDDPSPIDVDVDIPVGQVRLPGRLSVPVDPIGVVLFAHGSGSSRHSPRNRAVAHVLQISGIATVLFDLLTEPEEVDRGNVFDIELLASRLAGVVDWARDRPELEGLPVGLFGASTGAAAALRASVARPDAVSAVVSRGGRPDLAAPQLGQVTTPTLLIVGDRDHAVLDLNRSAAAEMACEHRLATVPGATHLFEEPGTLAIAADLARDWFRSHFTGG
jgi:putative phosphoribosyl transferase